MWNQERRKPDSAVRLLRGHRFDTSETYSRNPVHDTWISETDLAETGKLDEEHGNAYGSSSVCRVCRILRRPRTAPRNTDPDHRALVSTLDALHHMVRDNQGEKEIHGRLRTRHNTTSSRSRPDIPRWRCLQHRPSNRTMIMQMPPRAIVSSVQTSGKTSEEVAEVVNKYRSSAIQMMTNAGFKITDNVKVAVDPELPFMGYTMPQGKSFTIVVSGGAVGSEMLEGLLVHEMSHIYRIQTNHPSHDAEILEAAIEKLGPTNLRYDYQQKIVHDLLNDIQDLYADDISLQVLRATRTPILGQVSEFLQSMVIDKAANSDDPVKDRWVNASIMAHNARAIAQMTRQQIKDTGEKGARANQRFLAEISPDIAQKYHFFRNRLVNMREDITEDQYRAFLGEHLNQFVQAATKN